MYFGRNVIIPFLCIRFLFLTYGPIYNLKVNVELKNTVFDGDPRSKIFLGHALIKWVFSYSKFFVNLNIDSELLENISTVEVCQNIDFVECNSFIFRLLILHKFSLQKFVEPCETCVYFMPILSTQYWSVPSLLLDKNEIMHFSVSIFCCTISTCLCRFTLLVHVRFQDKSAFKLKLIS